MVANSKGIEYIIDDGLLICGNEVVAGSSAKKAPTKIETVKNALFQDDEKKKVYVTEVLALNVMYLDSKKDNKETQEDSTNEQQETTEPVNDPFAEFGERIEAEQLDLPF